MRDLVLAGYVLFTVWGLLEAGWREAGKLEAPTRESLAVALVGVLFWPLYILMLVGGVCRFGWDELRRGR